MKQLMRPKAFMALTALLCLIATETLAQSVWGSSRRDYGVNLLALSGLRVLLIALSTGAGFAIGWFLSPQSEHLRRKFLIGLALLVLFVAIVSNGSLGWSATSLASFAGFILALIYWLGSHLSSFMKPPTTFGSSRWANQDDLTKKNIFGSEGILLGSAPAGETDEVISYKGDRHLLTVAPTRSGKGTTQIIPNLLTYEGSMLVIDPKGENALITAKARIDMGQKVYIVDPWGIAEMDGLEAARFNPLDWLQLSDIDITENAMLLADALIITEGSQDPFWAEEAKALLQGIILYVATDKNEDGQRHLGRVRDLLLSDSEEMEMLFQKMVASPQHIVASTGARCLQKEPKLMANVLASAQAQTHFLDSTRIRESLSVSDFKFEDLKTEQMTIYLVLPADRLNAFGRWLRLLVQQAITVNARNIADKPEKPVLFILDEFAALGRLTMIEQAYGLMAGFGIQLWGIVQDFNQLERIYDKGWQSFVSNSGMINYFGSSDRMTSEYFSALCGETTVWNFSTAFSTVLGGNSANTTTDTRAASQRKLMYPDELMRMHEGKQLVFIENMHPLIASKTPWFEDETLNAKGVNLHE